MENEYGKFMKRCFALAKKGMGKTLPNPVVGCVLADGDGNIISKGYHKKCGENHAERDALLKIEGKVSDGAVLYVNLEPCSHFGKTPPCADLIIEKGVKKVVIGMGDPNPIVSGRGIKKLQEAGIEVIQGVLEDEAKELNKVFIKNITKKLPYITIKTAVSADSKIALSNGESKWITDDYSRRLVHKMRGGYQAILTGTGTVLADNPRLTSRIKGGQNPVRIIFDREGKIPLNYNVYEDNTEKIFVVTNSSLKYPGHIQKIKFKGFHGLFKELYNLGVYSILVEAGAGLNSKLIASKSADEINMFMAPKIFGGGKNFVEGFNFEKIPDCVRLDRLKCKKLKNDILITAKILYD